MLNLTAALASGPRVGHLRLASPRPTWPEAEPSPSPERQTTSGYTLKAPSGSPGFLVQQLLAGTQEPGSGAPSRGAMLAAYQAHVLHRISYTGPLTPIDLRV